MTRTPHHSKKKKSAVHGLPLNQAAVGGFLFSGMFTLVGTLRLSMIRWIQRRNNRRKGNLFGRRYIEKLEEDGSEAAKIVLMLIYAGMRIGELFSLPLEDYHETYVVGGEKTAAGRNRVIPIRPEGRGYFSYFAAQADGPLLLSGYTPASGYRTTSGSGTITPCWTSLA